jgi:hypothetical protein
MWCDSIKLPKGYEESTNENGFPVNIPTYTESIPANFLSAKRADKTLANQRGFTADIVIEIMACNYNDQNTLVDEKSEKEYDIIDTYQEKGKDTMQLTCQRR